MASTLQSWLLGLTLILLCLLRLSTTSPPISICADSEVPDINAVDRQTEGGSIPFEDLSVSDFQPNSKRRRITIDFFGDLGDLGDRLSSDSGTQADDVAHVDIPIKSADAGSSGLHREWRGSPVSHSAIDWSKHAIAGTQEGIRPVPGARRKRMEDVKNRMAKILEALEYFHQLAREQGVDKKIFGPQIKNTDAKLNQWFYDILFKKTEDSYPLFGQFEIKLTSVFSPENLFGSLQKEISKVIMGWKRPKLENIYEVALSLLGYWYQTTALKLGRADLKNNPETYWNLMAQLTVDRSPQGGLFSVEYNEGEDFFSTNLKRYIVEAKTRHQWEPLFVFLNSRRERNFGSSVTKDIKNRIEEKLKSSGLSRGLDATSKTKIADVPIYLIPSLQVKDTPRIQKCPEILVKNVNQSWKPI
ncbi:uncharacterized protein PGTG_08000 [Puccinia graminis f. sp. tritici CRL 75-36-700-3]|uniref:Uncharacterized protein n=1 Tax=Puccinia graminis f. sp. tritici (strain CRL 75-36-700-3 / race SCCL) TaxID=418459 RepID=E3KB38_PUCGT|nr:uncharacterized protein PGTG_08000 [Puccinia graminis f. sp. tritici CRL 75-36-700-3]EFP81751.2 hypothetical protein PGTG_08000 [Puccinia graminis f. sp. tritici CRL 75-36-700-3]